MTNQSVPWYQSAQIRTALGLLVPGTISLAHMTHLDKRLGIDLDRVNVDSVWNVLQTVGYVLAVIFYPIFSAWLWIKKRVRAGLDPKSPAPQIQAPAIVTGVLRITSSIRKWNGGA